MFPKSCQKSYKTCSNNSAVQRGSVSDPRQNSGSFGNHLSGVPLNNIYSKMEGYLEEKINREDFPKSEVPKIAGISPSHLKDMLKSNWESFPQTVQGKKFNKKNSLKQNATFGGLRRAKLSGITTSPPLNEQKKCLQNTWPLIFNEG